MKYFMLTFQPSYVTLKCKGFMSLDLCRILRKSLHAHETGDFSIIEKRKKRFVRICLNKTASKLNHFFCQ